jgi:cell division septation protein DedD
MHSDTILLIIAAMAAGICWAVVWLAIVAMRDARWLAEQFFDRSDDNPSTAPDEPLTETDLVVSRVLPPNNPPLPTPEQAIEGVRKAIRDAEATTTTSIPVLCYSGQSLTSLQDAVIGCDVLKGMLQERINASTA